MNYQAKKKAQQAELEFTLLSVWAKQAQLSFPEWLKHYSKLMGSDLYGPCIDLIAIYEEE